jgi:hypothetical protein
MKGTRAIGLGLTIAFVIAGCGSTVATSPSAVASTPPPAASATTSSPSASAGVIGQTNTAWGRIWDTLPAGFPTYAGATVSEEAATGPASATLVVNANVAKAVVTSMRTSLERAGFSTTAYSGPLEDGSYVLDLRGATDDCKVNLTATPRGSLTVLTILYGAACPHG